MDIEVDIQTSEKVPLICSFGGLRGALCEPVYEFKNFLFRHFDCNFIFVKDAHQCWYHAGVRGLGKDIQTTADGLQRKIDKIPHSKLITLGTSAGGYAAILFGHLLKADTIYAFSPQTFLDQANRQRYRDRRYQGELSKLYRCKYRSPDYYDLLTLPPSLRQEVGKIHIVLGVDDPVDTFHVQRMEDWENVSVKRVMGGHVVVKTMRDSGELVDFLEEISS